MFQAGIESRPKVPCVKIGGPKGPVHFTNKLWKRAELQSAPEKRKNGSAKPLGIGICHEVQIQNMSKPLATSQCKTRKSRKKIWEQNAQTFFSGLE